MYPNLLWYIQAIAPRSVFISQHMIKAWWKVAWQKVGKTLPVFTLGDEHNLGSTTQTWSLKLKSMIFKVIPEEKQQLVEEKMQII